MYVDNRGRWCDPGTTASAGKNRAMFRASPSGCSGFCGFGPFVTRGVSLDISRRGMSALVCGAAGGRKHCSPIHTRVRPRWAATKQV
jgi:hypothetical protein